LPGVCNITTNVNEDKRLFTCRFYPNPFSHSTVLQLQSTDRGVKEISLDVFDVTARTVFNKRIPVKDGSLKEELQLDLIPGIYFYSVGSDGIKSSTGKLVVQ
jgi:hypothetical protein